MGDGESDIISAIHDDLLGNIISRLPVKDAASTAALASRWRHLWRSTPLVLNDENLPEPTRAATVARVLADHPGPFHSVFLRHSRFLPLSPELAEWPRLLAAKAVEKLIFVNEKPFGAQSLAPYLCLPFDILRCASLEQLFLACWKLPDHLFRIPVAFPRLRRLAMVNIAMSDQDLDYLLAACPVLETLVLACPIKIFNLHNKSVRSVLLFLVGDFTVVEASLLDRLILVKPLRYVTTNPVRVKITSTSTLRVLGYMEPMIHKLEINGNIINPDTVPSPSTMVPGIKTLALKVNFCVLEELKMVAGLLRCFPNVCTLHIQSVLCDPSETATVEDHAQFWREASPVVCLRSHIKSLVFHKFQGHPNEFEFLKFVARDEKALQSLLLVPPREKFLSEDEVNEMIEKLGCPWFRAWTTNVLQLSPEVANDWSPVNVCDITVDDPFR